MSSTNWRTLGDTSLATYKSEFQRRNSPLLSEVESIYNAVKGYSLLYLAQAGMESEYAKTGYAAASPEAHNALGTKVRGGNNEYQRFASWTDGAKEWRARILDPAYAYSNTVSLADYIHVYAPSSDGNDEAAYVAFINDYRAQFPSPSTTTTPPPSTSGGSPVVTPYQPTIIDKYLHVTQDGYAGVIRYIPGRNGNIQRIIVIHIQEGTNWGSWTWFHQVSASATVMIAKNGDVWRLVPEEHGPWTNGDVKSPDAFMTAVMNRWGWDPNVYSLTIESEGYSGGLPYTDNQRKSIYWQVNQWVTKYDIQAIYIVGHGQINSVDRYYCPEAPNANGKRPFVEAIRAQAGSVPVIDVPTEVYRDPWPVKTDAGVLWDGLTDITVTTGPSPVTFYADKGQKTIDVDLLYGRQWASTTSTLTNNAKSNGQTIDALGWVEGEEVDGERRWWVAKDGTRYWSGGTAETPTKQAPIPETPDDPNSNPDYGNLISKIPVVLNGNVYYPFDDREGDAGRGRQMTVIADGKTYTWAGSTSAEKGTVKEGDKRFVAYWVRGEKIGDEDLWYVLDDGTTDPVKSAPRIWAGLMEDRPD